MHEELPSVTHLAIHLTGEQAIYFPDSLNRDELQMHIDNSKTTLTSFFDYNHLNEEGRCWLDHEFPEHYRVIAKRS